MDFKRGANLAAICPAGPHFSAIVNEVEYDIIDKLNKFNAWVDMSNTLNPESILQQQHCTWLCFTRRTKNLVLCWCAAEQCWELDGLVVEEPKPDDGNEGGCAAAPDDGPPDQPLGGGNVELVLSGGFYLPPEETKQRPMRKRRWTRRGPPEDHAAKPRTEREREPAAAAKRKTKRITKRPLKRIMLRTCALLRKARQSPRFRHMQSQIEASVAEMKVDARLLRDTACALALATRRWIARAAADVRSFFTEDFDSAPSPQVYLESRRIEIRPGFTLVLYNFDSAERPNWDAWLFGKLEIEIEYPNWESWLFGKPVEDEQKVA